jgi:hypothetical protein
VNPEDNLGPCELFTLLASSQLQNVTQCEVCDHPESAHQSAGRRALSGGEIEELRRRIIVQRFEQRQQDHGEDEGPSFPGMSLNGNPEVH